ncbi:hypothetical protein MMC13_006362 [Lambiella insularis]|nr:hypothetical protein [Lambiella insularis]
MPPTYPLPGSCACTHIRYSLLSPPLITQACHCSYCQRESGSAFALNALIEASEIRTLGPEPLLVPTPAASGRAQLVARCPRCFVAVWSTYADLGPRVRAVRVGTLEGAGGLEPEVHIFAEGRRAWVREGEGVRVFEGGYQRGEVWRRESLERWARVGEGGK